MEEFEGDVFEYLQTFKCTWVCSKKWKHFFFSLLLYVFKVSHRTHRNVVVFQQNRWASLPAELLPHWCVYSRGRSSGIYNGDERHGRLCFRISSWVQGELYSKKKIMAIFFLMKTMLFSRFCINFVKSRIVNVRMDSRDYLSAWMQQFELNCISNLHNIFTKHIFMFEKLLGNL